MKNQSDQWIASPEAERFDIELAYWDCVGTRAHVLMLKKQGIINAPDSGKVLEALDEIEKICAALWARRGLCRSGTSPGAPFRISL